MLDMHCLRQGTHKTHAAIKNDTDRLDWIGHATTSIGVFVIDPFVFSPSKNTAFHERNIKGSPAFRGGEILSGSNLLSTAM
jgi:hypothetical protein